MKGTSLTLMVVGAMLMLWPAYASGQSIASTYPVANALGVPVNTDITVTFDADMDGSSINDSTIIVTGASTGRHSGVISYDNGTRTATFGTTTDFIDGEVVVVVLTDSIKSPGGSPLTGGYAWSFTTKVNTSPALGCTTGCLGVDTVYTTASGAHSVVSADLNGDGYLDLAVAATSSLRITVLLYDAVTERFGSGADYMVGDQPVSVAAGDLDNDGDLDIVSANSGGNTVSVLLNAGNGSFAPQTTYPVGGQPWAVCTGDLNGDGRKDLITANYGSNDVSVLLNNGNGLFASQATYPVAGTPMSVYSGDLNGDGCVDIAVGGPGSNISVLMNNCNGTLGPHVDYNTGNQNYSIIGADFDGDGDLDLASVQYYDNEVTILRNNGQGVFSPYAVFPIGVNSLNIVAADFDGDSDIDIASANEGSNDISVLLNNGNASFSSQIVYPLGISPKTICAADIDKDGDVDLATAQGSSLLVLNHYRPGDASNDNKVNSGDAVYIISYIFKNGPPPRPIDAGDANGDCAVNLGDATWVINYVFRSGPAPICGCAYTGTGPCVGQTNQFSKTLGGTLSTVTVRYDGRNTDVVITSSADIYGFQAECQSPEDATPINQIADMQLFSRRDDDRLVIGMLDINGIGRIPAGETVALSFPGHLTILSALGADETGNTYEIPIRLGEKTEALPNEYALDQNQPNPFNPATTIGFSLPEPGRVVLTIYNISGQVVRTLIDGYADAGCHAVVWDGKDASGRPAASGIYLYRIQAGDFTNTRKMVLAK